MTKRFGETPKPAAGRSGTDRRVARKAEASVPADAVHQEEGVPAGSPSVSDEGGASRMIYGFHAVLGKLRRDPEGVFELYVAAQRTDVRARDAHKLAESQGVRVIQAESERLDRMVGTRRHQGVVARIDGRRRELRLADVLEGLEDSGETALILVLDGIQDPHNLGACLRVADAAGAHAVIAPKDRAVGLNATAAKVASGAADTVPYVTVTNLARAMRELQAAGVWVVGASDDAEKTIFEVVQKGPVAWVMGAEGDGMRRLTRDTCDELVRIPMHGSVESLNVSVASGVCLFETRRQRGG